MECILIVQFFSIPKSKASKIDKIYKSNYNPNYSFVSKYFIFTIYMFRM